MRARNAHPIFSLAQKLLVLAAFGGDGVPKTVGKLSCVSHDIKHPKPRLLGSQRKRDDETFLACVLYCLDGKRTQLEITPLGAEKRQHSANHR